MSADQPADTLDLAKLTQLAEAAWTPDTAAAMHRSFVRKFTPTVALSLLARVAALEAALRSIAANTCCDRCREAALVARAALAPPENAA